MKAQIEITLRSGNFGEKSKRVVISIEEYVARQILSPVEISDDPYSIMLASPCLHGGKGNAASIRNEAFRLRRGAAREIAQVIEEKLVELFGNDDVKDGYTKRDLQP